MIILYNYRAFPKKAPLKLMAPLTVFLSVVIVLVIVVACVFLGYTIYLIWMYHAYSHIPSPPYG